MITKKLKGIYFLICLLLFLTGICCFAAIVMLGGGIMDENGVPLTDGTVTLFSCVFFVLAISYFCALAVVLKQVIKYKGIEFSADAEGLHNVAMVINLLAFIFAAHIKFIPWSAVTAVLKDDEEIAVLKIDSSSIKASPIGKLLLRMFGVRIHRDALSAKELDTICRYAEKN